MSILAIPTSDAPFATQATTLDGTVYELEFRYNQREACWYFSISLEDGTELLRGIKIVVGVSLLGRSIDSRLPPGELVAVANTEDDSPPALDELGIDRRVTLTYTPTADFVDG